MVKELIGQNISQLVQLILTSRVYDVVSETPMHSAEKLSRRLGNEILFKREDLQPVFSFKIRGAYNKIAHLTKDDQKRGVITASAGNHAQGVAYSSQKLGIYSVIVMPRTTPRIKVDSVRQFGSKVVLEGDSYTEAQAYCDEIGPSIGLTFVHPFDDPLVISGQGTIATEIHRQSEEKLSAVFVPVGGGGLIAGIGSYIKTMMPGVKVVGVEPFDADAMYQSLSLGRRVRLAQVGMFADGVAVHKVGEQTFEIAKETIDEIVRVSNDEICAAMKDVFDDTRSVMEPAGALAVAGLKRYIERESISKQRVVAVLSGANMNFDRLRFVAERAELGEEKETILAVTIPERPGSFREFCTAVGRRVITEFNYRVSEQREAHIFVGISTESRKDSLGLIENLRNLDYETSDLSDNEMAKLHIRHMIGGHAPRTRNEVVYRFEFPERPGALMDFLNKLDGRWNINLFHYRNHGSDFGRILAGFEVPDVESEDFKIFLDTLGYPHIHESSNEAYHLFLG